MYADAVLQPQDLVGSIDSGTFREAQRQDQMQHLQQQHMVSGTFGGGMPPLPPPQQQASPDHNVPTGVSMVRCRAPGCS